MRILMHPLSKFQFSEAAVCEEEDLASAKLF